MAKDINEFHYDAFISYRHTQPDQFIAENLHKQLEKFRLPGNVARKLKKDNPEAKTRITRVFRDEEELPLASNLEDPIVVALQNSDWLIVICSPRLKESQWCRKEIETFINLHGTDRILAVLVEGEPEDSFPAELLSREIQVTRPDGLVETVKQKIEPLAADFRGDNDKQRLKQIKSQKLRLLAPMFGLNYDALRQRHREQRMRRVIFWSLFIALISFAFGAFSTFMAIQINKQNIEISEQAQRIQDQANEISLQSQEIKDKNESLLAWQAESLAQDALGYIEDDDRKAALATAYAALTEYDGEDMPYTDSAFFALTESLLPYENQIYGRAKYTMEMNGTVNMIVPSPSGIYAAIGDTSGYLTVWSMENGRLVYSEEIQNFGIFDGDVCFVDDDNLLYIVDSGLYSLNISTGETECVKEKTGYSLRGNIFMDYDNQRYVVFIDGDVAVYDSSDNSLIYEYEMNSYWDPQLCKMLDDELLVVVETSFYDSETVMHFINISDDTETEYSFDSEYFEDCIYDGEYIYILTEQIIDNGSVMGSLVNEIKAVDFSTFDTAWTRQDSGIYGHTLCFINEDDGQYLVSIGNKGVLEVNKTNGEKVVSDYYDNSIVWYEINDSYVEYLTAGTYYMRLGSYTTLGQSNLFDCHLKDITIAADTSGGFLMCELNSSKVILYGSMIGKNISVYDGNFKNEENEVYRFSDATELAEELGIESYYNVLSIAYDYDEEYIVVSYNYGKAQLIDLDDMTVCATIDLGSYECITKYFGEDKQGNLYWASDDVGYCFSENNKLIARIDLLYAVDADNNQLIMGYNYDGATHYCSDILSLDDLLEMAEDYLY